MTDSTTTRRIRTLLIANRGEIACRIMRTARRMGIRTVAVYSEVDADAMHVRQADAAVLLGPAPAQQSYLAVDRLLAAAERTGADAIHPGYGFLSENADFAQAVADAGMVFVGPEPSAIRAMGSKIEAKRIVAAAGTPVVPGYHGDDQRDATLRDKAQEVGFPLLIKASSGGGGKGMRLVAVPEDFDDALAGARREAAAAFGDDAVLLERYLSAPKHIEVQLLADQHGHTVHLFERDCSVQRRHQKVVEEAPAPGMHPEVRDAMGRAAIAAAQAIGYTGAGTVEFICEGDAFYFMEMNTRLQVEHPVTELVTGVDLVEWQLRVAAGEGLGFDQSGLSCGGHAVEVRVYAENPRRSFLPSTGRLHTVEFPDSVRVDAGVTGGSEVSAFYDPMLAKLIAHGRDRQEALARLDEALKATVIIGVEHNVGYLRAVLAHPEFLDGRYTTHLAEDGQEALVPGLPTTHAVVAARFRLADLGDAESAWGDNDGFRLNLAAAAVVRFMHNRVPVEVSFRPDGAVAVDGNPHTLKGWRLDGEAFTCRVDDRYVAGRTHRSGRIWFVAFDGATERFEVQETNLAALSERSGAGDRVISPMPGQVIAVHVRAGDRVDKGAALMVVEAMKMEHTVRASRPATVAAVLFAAGDRVDDGAELVQLRD